MKDSFLCKSGVHCGICRADSEAGRNFRDSLLRNGMVSGRDFQCPWDKPADFEVTHLYRPAPVQMTVSAKPKPRPAREPMGADARALVDKQARQLGDDVEKLIHAMGGDRLAKVFEELTGWGCGCDERKSLLNRIGRKLGYK